MKITIGNRIKAFLESNANERIRTNILQAIPFWVASILTGLVAVGYTRLFNMAEEVFRAARGWHPWLIFILSPVNFLIAWLMVKMFSPAAGGSGIPQVMAAIHLSSSKHEKTISKLLNLKTLVVKIISCMFMVLGGGAIGREGPTIQISGTVFRLVNKYTPRSWPKLSERSFIITGAAAGLAAAFNTPLGGIVFAIEELAKIHISSIRTALFTAVIIAGLTAQGILGPYLYLGYPDVRNLSNIIFLDVAIAAALAGFLGALMSRTVFKLIAWRKSFSTKANVLFVLCAGLALASVAYFFDCSITGSGKELMNEVLFGLRGHASFKDVVVRILGPIFCFSTGGSGGIFAPSLAAGASIGSYLSVLGGFVGANANILILSGMVGFLTGVTRTPFTSAILVLEMTDRHGVIFHLMLAALISNIAALLVEKRSLYEKLKDNYLEEARITERREPAPTRLASPPDAEVNNSTRKPGSSDNP